MSLLIKNALIIDPLSPFYQQTQDILISSGVIQKISHDIADVCDQTIDLKGNWISPGWVDLSVFSGDPGHEHKEDIQSLLDAALAGGFTTVCMQPETDPVIDNKGQIAYLQTKSKSHPVNLLPIGAVSVGLKGEVLAELMDQHGAGVSIFSSGNHPTGSAELLLKALQYTQMFGGTICSRPFDASLTKYGQMNEGATSTYMGLKGMPALAEVLAIKKELEILEYAGGRLHFTCISTCEGLELIRHAKSKGLAVTCDVAIANLVYDESALTGFDTNYKVNPPFRSEENLMDLRDGLIDGTIDAIVTDHQPHDVESKELEFDLAAFGITGLETCIHHIGDIYTQFDIDHLIPALTHGPRKILGLPEVKIDVGFPATLSMFDPEHTWTYDERTCKSKSYNSPLFRTQLTGKALGIIVDGHFTPVK